MTIRRAQRIVIGGRKRFCGGWIRVAACAVTKAVAFVFLSCVNAWSATYYVDSVNGNDTRSGTTSANAWKTLQRVNQAILAPGDTVLLKRGGLWREKLYIQESGTAASPIGFGAYGTGAAPEIDGSDVVTGWNAAGTNLFAASVATQPEVVILGGIKGVREAALEGLNAAGEWHWANGTLTVYSTSAPANVEASARQFLAEFLGVSYVNFRDINLLHGVDCVRMADTTNVTVENVSITDSAGYAGVLFGAQTAGRGERNTVRNCTITGIVGSSESIGHGGFGHGVFVWGMNICRQNTFSGNTVHDNGGGGILLIDTSANTVSGNAIYRHGSAGIVISELNSSGNILERNFVYENCRKENDCFGINIYRVGNDNLVRYNVVHNQYVFTDDEVGIPGFTERSGGIRFDGDTWIGVTDKTGNAIIGNLIHDEFEGIQVFNFSNVTVTNNTVYNTTRSGIYVGSYGATGTARDVVLRNNLVHTSAQQLIWSRNTTNAVFDFNAYYPDGASAFNLNGTLRNFASWRAATGQDASSITANPLPVNLAARDFHLQSGSPCIDRGTLTGAPASDLDNVNRPQGAGIDIGAYEYAAPPTAAFSAVPRSGEGPLQVQFNDLSSPGTSAITAWAWDFDNNGTVDSTAQHPIHTYNASGRYSVSLRVTNLIGSDTKVELDFINVTTGPSAEFTGTPTSGIAPLLVAFTDNSAPGGAALTRWAWDFNDDGIPDSSQRNPAWTFGPGKHTVSLTVTDANNMSDTHTKVEYIAAEVLPTASFIAAPSSGFTPLAVQFTDTSQPGTKPITEWLWDFGDGETSASQNPSHTYTSAGSFAVSLTVTTAAGSNSKVSPGLISTQQPALPAAQFSANPRSGTRPLDVQFTDLSAQGTYAIHSWLWDFGDGATSTQTNPSHAYALPGVYTVSLTVTTDAGGSTETKPAYIQVAGGSGPIASFSATPTSGMPPLTVSFTDTSSPGDASITDWHWDFGDGGTSAARHPVHGYQQPGVFTVQLTVTTSLGSDTAVRPDLVLVFGAIFVDKDNTSGVQNGTAWSTALTRIQDGIDAAAAIGGGEVWVAEGSYGESRADANGSVVLRPGVHIFGGFAGIETQRAQRDWNMNVTVIDGSAARAGAPAYHVVAGSNNATLDGFVVTGGVADSSNSSRDRGAGMFNQNASPAVSNCVFRNNTAIYAGGAMYNANASSPVVTGCRFENNSVSGSFLSSGLGGAVYSTGAPNLKFINCLFIGNAARATLFNDGIGGAMYNFDSTPRLTNCSFYNNRSYGAFFSNGNGGGVYNRLSSPVVANCILWADVPNEIVNSGGGGAVVTFSDVQGGYSGTGNLNANPQFVNAPAGNLELTSTSPCLDTASLAAAPATDIRGVPRPQGTGVDMGAYERSTPPAASFSLSGNRGVVPYQVRFTDTSQPGSSPIESWLWDFGDGETSTFQHPVHTYLTDGEFSVSLSVRTAAGLDLSAPVLITVGAPVTFNSQPENQYAYTGEFAHFAVDIAGGLGEISYQWWFDDGGKAILLADAAEETLDLGGVALDDGGVYWCTVSDELGVYASAPALLAVAEPLEIVRHPEGAVKQAGQSHTFEVEISGGFLPIDFIWKKEETPIFESNEPRLVIERLLPSDEGRYLVEVYDSYRMVRVSQEANLTVTGAAVPIGGAGVLCALAAAIGLAGSLLVASTHRRTDR